MAGRSVEFWAAGPNLLVRKKFFNDSRNPVSLTALFPDWTEIGENRSVTFLPCRPSAP